MSVTRTALPSAVPGLQLARDQAATQAASASGDNPCTTRTRSTTPDSATSHTTCTRPSSRAFTTDGGTSSSGGLHRGRTSTADQLWTGPGSVSAGAGPPEPACIGTPVAWANEVAGSPRTTRGGASGITTGSV